MSAEPTYDTPDKPTKSNKKPKSDLLKRADDARQNKRWIEAVKLYDQHLKENPDDADNVCWRAYSLWQGGDLEGAIEGYTAASKIEPQWAGVHNCLGSINKQMGRPDVALAEYNEALRLSPHYGEAHANLAGLLKSQHKYADALNHYRLAVEGKPGSADLYLDLARALMDQGFYAQANMAIREAIRLVPTRTQFQTVLATLLSRQDKHDESIKVLTELVTTFPDDASFHSRLAWAYWKAERHDEAKKSAQDALWRNQNLPYPNYLLGWIAQKRDEKDAAIGHYKRYLELDPGDSEGAQLALSRLGAAPVPERASDSYMKQIYANRAAFWDGNMESKTRYRAPLQVADALEKFMGPREGLDVMDMGCGTGMGGKFLRQRARRLDGLDMSPHMLEKAREKGFYDELIEGDLLKVLPARPERYDVVASAATLLHFGDLGEPFKAVAATLKPGGWFSFTVFPALEGNKVQVLPFNCHGHSPEHIRERAEETGFETISVDRQTHEYHKDEPQPGLVVVLRKRGGTGA